LAATAGVPVSEKLDVLLDVVPDVVPDVLLEDEPEFVESEQPVVREATRTKIAPKSAVDGCLS
jgi:hypothetical protein